MLSTLVALSAILSGLVLGYIGGFSMAAHSDVSAGVRPKTKSRFLLLLARPTASYNFLESLIFFIIMIAWLPIFFVLCAVPAIIGNKLGIDDPITIKLSYFVFACTLLIARRIGVRAWNALI